jgi:hypothetical protein
MDNRWPCIPLLVYALRYLVENHVHLEGPAGSCRTVHTFVLESSYLDIPDLVGMLIGTYEYKDILSRVICTLVGNLKALLTGESAVDYIYRAECSVIGCLLTKRTWQVSLRKSSLEFQG